MPRRTFQSKNPMTETILTEPSATSELLTLPEVASPQLGNTRPIYLYLPPSYAAEPTRRYPVVYLHDGQNLFDDALAFAGAWGVQHALDRLSGEGIEAIAVGIAHTGPGRMDEASPYAHRRPRSRGLGERYLDFLVETVKPTVDAGFRTRPERESTALVGSSMGGLISLYGFFARPAAFGLVGAISPALWFANRAIFPTVAAAPPIPGRIYLDIGTAEGTRVVADARAMRDQLVRKGYHAGRDLRYVEAFGATHSEAAWSLRLPEMFRYLLASER